MLSIIHIYIYSLYRTIYYSGQNSGHSAGYSISLVAETTTGAQLSIERTAEQGELPEQVGNEAALLLLQEIKNGKVLTVAAAYLIYSK
jgi:RNA 3'-terminal phosphate cyclase-like protein